MSYHDSEEPISIVEDLDPEPPSRPGSSQRLELLVGLALLACVLAFVGYQWWHQQAQVSDYSNGQSSLASNDWDAALSYFSYAGDYRDAPQQAAHARQQISERNRLYASAQQHTANAEWLDAVADLRAVSTIQPAYLDIDAQQHAALQNVYTAALSGTIALRPNANPPGLYYYIGTGWLYLQDSDERSAIFDSDRSGRFVYDIPAEPAGSAPPRASPPNVRIAVSNIRYYRVAQLTGNTFAYSHLDIDPERFNQVTLNDNGVWAFSYEGAPSDAPDGYSNSNADAVGPSFFGVKMEYQPFDGPISPVDANPTFTPTFATGLIIAVDPVSNRYLSADYTNALAFKARSDTVVKLYLNQAGSATKQLIYTHTGGGLPGAQLSPDGRYVLLKVFNLRPNGAIDKTSAVLIDLQNIAAPHVIHEVTTSMTTPLGTAFISSGVFAGDIALYERTVTSIRLFLIDPAQVGSATNPQGVIQSVTVPNQTGNMWALLDANADGVTLLGQSYEPSSYPVSHTISLVRMSPQGQPTVGNIEMPANSYFANIQVKDDTAAWVTNIYPMGGTSNVTTNIAIATLRPHSSDPVQPTIVFTSTYDPIAKNVNTTPSISLGTNLIAYSLNQQLHARTYSGSADIILEGGASYLRNFRNEVYTSFWDTLH